VQIQELGGVTLGKHILGFDREYKHHKVFHSVAHLKKKIQCNRFAEAVAGLGEGTLRTSNFLDVISKVCR